MMNKANLKAINLRSAILLILVVVSACEKEDPILEPAIADYYVHPDGDDNNTGDFDQPWATWQHAMDQAVPGDTIYIRGGTYTPRGERNALNIYMKHGTPSNPICLFNYPDERPVLDCSKKAEEKPSIGINIVSSSHIILRGLDFAGTKQSRDGETTVGCYLLDCNRISLVQVRSYSHQGSGFWSEDCDTILYRNCDSYDNYDLHSKKPGGNGDGFGVGHNPDLTDILYLTGCRAWNNSDDGFDAYYNEGTVVLDSCWAFSNGRDQGDGSGFKLGKTDQPAGDFPQRVARFCIAADNKYFGFNENIANVKMVVYNNSSFGNLNGFGNFRLEGTKEEMIYRNNLAYGNSDGPTHFQSGTNDQYNTWNLSLELTDEDFENLNPDKLKSDRQEDGSLPDITFMKLKDGSELIDAGIDVGLPYEGTAPDLGAFEKK